ncbi:hypothetical protein [Haloferula sp.]|uniref:hypothetical protein n=1 Tax=Haloferula sp. TaxID=2497595 RepID=UPI003C75A26C
MSGEVQGISTELATILGQSDPVDRAREWLEFVDSIDPSQMEKVVSAFRLGKLEIHRSEYEILFGQWAKDRPEEALAYIARELPTGDFERGTVLTQWAESDYLSALSWANRNPSGQGGLNNSILYVAKGIAGSQPALAAQLLESQPAIRERPSILGQVIPQVLSLGPDEAKLWPDYFENPDLKAVATSKLAAALVRDSPEDTMRWIAEMDGPGRDMAYRDAVSALAATDTEAALGYALAAPEGSARDEAFSGLVRSTAQRDPQKAAAIIDAYPEIATDTSVQGLVWFAAQRDPALGAEYLNRIEEPQALETSLRTLTANWRRRDPEALES